ncbi:Glycosyl transferase family group 2 [Halorubrum xinjiangense]|uniref:Glycosyl transferase family group 2 n=1 Tax=Halorubrum xinjiangense TaxID=261291 RepID=A0A1G7KMY0_9EURY|nr:glycosyltransferase family 2 protein [Halorubrum xinjiangense]SDF38545.1 Glycosyl transferase family group 2 [Halorubrum xinjiangense]
MATVLTLAVLTLVWSIFVLYSLSVLFWLYEVLVLARNQLVSADELAYGHDDVQVRILTIGAESVVQATVNSVPDGVDDIRVIAEEDIQISGATVHVVPDEFGCKARHKGRALEWARRNVPCSHEFILYLDEDTIVQQFRGLPDADVVQITEMPLYTGSWIAYLSETFRIGYQYEQRAFGRFKYPLYAWGGGIAIRKSLEDAITWDTETITEDTNFIWRAAQAGDLDFRVLNLKFRNQAPPSLRGMFRQRRRWFAGTQQSSDLLPQKYRLFLGFRMVAWSLSPLIPVMSLLLFLFPQFLPQPIYYQFGSLAMFLVLFVITLVGVFVYIRRERVPLLAIPLTPLLVVLNTVGALWGWISPVETFAVTEKVAPIAEKVSPKTIEKKNPWLGEGDLENHDGEELLIEDGGFEAVVLDD